MTSAAQAKRPRLWLVGASKLSTPPDPSRDPLGDGARPEAALAFDDSELLRALRDGHIEAATALHDRVRPQVDRTIRRLLGAGDVDHEDLVQLTMIEIVQSIDRFRGDCSLDGWVSTVAAHVVYKHIRRRRTERRLFGNVDADDAMPASTACVGREAQARSMLRRVLNHIGAIEEAKAWAYVLHDVCGYDLKEIAQITGVSVAAAQTRLVRGRREVHERIAADPELANLLEDMGERA
jgi:RNA polymerase sigma-70 factor (ECF subfamily)